MLNDRGTLSQRKGKRKRHAPGWRGRGCREKPKKRNPSFFVGV